MKRFLAIVLLLLSGSLCWGLSFYTIQIVKSSDGCKYMVRDKPLPVGTIAEQVAMIAMIEGTNAFVRIQVSDNMPIESLFPIMNILHTNGIRRFSIFIPKDRNGDGVCDFRENMEAMLTVDNVLTNGCLEGEYWGYDDGSSRKQVEKESNPSNKPPNRTR